jgi:hypothetical protein
MLLTKIFKLDLLKRKISFIFTLSLAGAYVAVSRQSLTAKSLQSSCA